MDGGFYVGRVHYQNFLWVLCGVQYHIAARIARYKRGRFVNSLSPFCRSICKSLAHNGCKVVQRLFLFEHGIGKAAACLAEFDAFIFFVQGVVNCLNDLCFCGYTQLDKTYCYNIAKLYAFEGRYVLVFFGLP